VLDFFDIVKNNIYYVVVAIFFLYKIFGGSNKKSTSVAPKKVEMNTPERYDAELDTPQHTAYEEPEVSAPRIFKQKEFEKPARETEAAVSSYQPPIRHVATQVREAERNNHSHKPVHEREKLTKQGIRSAVLWAEILGPPRAKKPYRRK